MAEKELLREEIFEQGEGTDPQAVKISHALFVQAQFSDQKLTKLNSYGNSFLYNDNRSGIVVAWETLRTKLWIEKILFRGLKNFNIFSCI